MSKYRNKLVATGLVAGLGLAAIPALAIALGASSSASATGVSGTVRLNAEVAMAIAMKITSPNDTNPDCMEQSGITYGVANRYATSNGAEGSKQVDTFDGTPGGADEINNNTSCATLTMNPNAFSSTYSDITIYTNSPNGYSLTVRSADNTSPNLVNTTDPTQYIEAGALTESNGTTPGGQNKWALKSDTGLLDTWTPVATTDTTVRAYDQETHNGSNTRVTYGISSGNNPTGKYTTTLTYTATMFDSAMNPDVPTANIALGTDGSGTGSGTGTDIDPTAQIELPEQVTIPYRETRTVPVEVKPGYQIDTITCDNGYDCSNYNTGDDATGSQTIDITNNTKDNSGSISITTKPIEYPVEVTAPDNSDPDAAVDFGDDFTPEDFTVPYGQSNTITVTPAVGHEVVVTCANGYTCSTSDVDNTDGTQDITITNNETLGGGSVTVTTKPIDYPVEVTTTDPDLDLGDLANEDFTVPYGESETVTVTPPRGHEVVITCAEGYTCEASNATGDSTQDITITNNNTTSGSAISVTTKPIEYPVIAAGDPENDEGSLTISDSDLSVPYGESKTVLLDLHEGYDLETSCPEGYTCEARTATTDEYEENSMQDFRVAVHGDDAENTSYILTDARDGKTYRVAKLKDGNWWMAEDLALGGDSAITLTQTDSDASPAGYTLAAHSGTTYTWYQATAGSGTAEMTSGDAASSICPKGWNLPTGTEYYELVNAYGGPVISGGSDSSTMAKSATASAALQESPVPGFSASVWSSSASSYMTSTYGRALQFASAAVYYDGYYGVSKDSPRAVRCMADNTTPTPTVVTITNDDTIAGGSVSFKTEKKNYEVAITPSINATTSTNSLSIPYGESKTFTITPVTGYYLTSVSCSNGYTCSGYSTGSASNPNATARGTQTIMVTNNSYANTGAVSFNLNNKYRISFSKTNMSSPSSSYTDVAYGSSTTVTVTPANGYYLSTVTCPSGYTCSGVSTGPEYTSAQTLTITNNRTASTGTVVLEGVNPWDANCTKTIHSKCIVNGVEYVYLRDNNYWTVDYVAKNVTWDEFQAMSCPTGTKKPTKNILSTIDSIYADNTVSDPAPTSSAQEYKQAGGPVNIWATTTSGDSAYYLMGTGYSFPGGSGSVLQVSTLARTSKNNVACYYTP